MSKKQDCFLHPSVQVTHILLSNLKTLTSLISSISIPFFIE